MKPLIHFSITINDWFSLFNFVLLQGFMAYSTICYWRISTIRIQHVHTANFNLTNTKDEEASEDDRTGNAL